MPSYFPPAPYQLFRFWINGSFESLVVTSQVPLQSMSLAEMESAIMAGFTYVFIFFSLLSHLLLTTIGALAAPSAR